MQEFVLASVAPQNVSGLFFLKRFDELVDLGDHLVEVPDLGEVHHRRDPREPQGVRPRPVALQGRVRAGAGRAREVGDGGELQERLVGGAHRFPEGLASIVAAEDLQALRDGFKLLGPQSFPNPPLLALLRAARFGEVEKLGIGLQLRSRVVVRLR